MFLEAVVQISLIVEAFESQPVCTRFGARKRARTRRSPGTEQNLGAWPGRTRIIHQSGHPANSEVFNQEGNDIG